jgi:molybdate transport system ATP-binding protein
MSADQNPPLVADLTLCRPLGFALNLRLRLPRGVTVLVGPSGSGKSTTLDLLAGHVRPDRGRIELFSDVLFDRQDAATPPRIDVAVQKRRIGYVMQSPSLFPHLDVHHNLAYGLADWPPPEKAARLAELTEALGLSSLLSRQPRALSGGERQKVALARALAPRPRALLLDEPLSAVDLPQRDGLLHRLRELLAALDIPVLYVTHSLEEQRFFAASQSAGRALCLRPQADGRGVEVAEL